MDSELRIQPSLPRSVALAVVLLVSLVAAPGRAQAPPAEGESASSGETVEEQRPDAERDRTKERKLSRREMRRLEEQLPAKYRQWLQDVEYLISKEERVSFLVLDEDYERDAFIERFWEIRDPYPSSGRNEFQEQWYERIRFAAETFGDDENDDRRKMLLLNGVPTARIPFRCTGVVYPLEVWFYDGSDKVGYEFFLVFYRKYGGQRFWIWRPSEGMQALLETGASASQGAAGSIWDDIYTCRDGDVVVSVLSRLMHPSMRMEQEMILAEIERPSQNPDSEWLLTFDSYSTDIPDDARTFPAEVTVTYPDRHQARTVVSTTIAIDPEKIGTSQLADFRGYNLYVNGEILTEDQRLFEQFRYKFDFSESDIDAGKVPLVYQRRLRPGPYKMVLKVEDLNSGSFFRDEIDLDVPNVLPEETLPENPEDRDILERATIAIGGEIPTLEIVEDYDVMATGMVRFETLTTGKGIDQVRFTLNGRELLRKQKPPYSVELDLGRVPRTHVLRAAAYDDAGKELTSDEVTINAGEHQFSVRLIEPRQGIDYAGHVDAEAAVLTPEGRPLERLEFYYDEKLAATVYQAPWVQRIELPDEAKLGYVRAVAYLPDGNTTDDMVFINAPDYLENLEIEFVELYAAVIDKQNRPIQGLEQEQFKVLEDGAEQEIVRFEKVDDLPIHVEVVIDRSASMEEKIDTTQEAALRFFQQGVSPRDRASLVTFNDHPHLAVKFTNELDELAGGLAGLKAERGTSLYDAVVFGLFYMNGLKGQKAMLLLSDGKDESSRFSFEDTLDFARRAGAAIYTIGLDIRGKGSGQAKKNLRALAEETGGRHFFIEDVSELESIYESILQELRSRYLIAYQSTNTATDGEFRSIELRTSIEGATAKTMRGYYP